VLQAGVVVNDIEVRKADLEEAMREMISYKGPYVLDVEVPYQEHVLPMIPGGKTVDDMILE
jgi:acetolactate synthase-1/2/3 large subunit